MANQIISNGLDRHEKRLNSPNTKTDYLSEIFEDSVRTFYSSTTLIFLVMLERVLINLIINDLVYDSYLMNI